METKENKHQEYIEERKGIIFLTIICTATILAVAVYLIVLSIINNNGTFATCGIALGGVLLFLLLICNGFHTIVKRLKKRVEEAWSNNRWLYTRINYLERALNDAEERICELQIGISRKGLDINKAIREAKPKFEAAVTKACNDYRDELIKNIMPGEGGIYEQKKY